MNEFFQHLPKWGGFVKIKRKSKQAIINTCSIDYFLLGFWAASKLSLKFIDLINNSTCSLKIQLLEVIELIEQNDWDRAKTQWLIDINQMNSSKNSLIDAFGCQYDLFVKHVIEFQLHHVKSTCVCGRENFYLSKNIEMDLDENNRPFFMLNKKVCTYCSNLLAPCVEFQQTSPFLIIENVYNKEIKNTDLDKLFEINGIRYKLLFCTHFIQHLNHFISLFDIDNMTYLIDDLKRNTTNVTSDSYKISFAFYYIIS